MTTKLSTGLRNAIAGTVGLAGALNSGVIHVYSGPQPATADAKATGTLLGTVSLNGAEWTSGSPTNALVFAAAANGGVAKPANAVWKFNALAAGTIGWFRHIGPTADNAEASTVLARIDGSATADAQFSTLNVVLGQPVTLDLYSVDFPAQ